MSAIVSSNEVWLILFGGLPLGAPAADTALVGAG